jgi:predicted alpha/beta superfamily hydrolase
MTEFVVRIPPGTPWDRGLFIAGDAEPLGHWQPDAIRLAPYGDGTWRAGRVLPRGLHARYLVTLGTFRTAECGPGGVEQPPRELVVFGSAAAETTVTAWGRDSLKHHHHFESAFLPNDRPVTVWLPPGYEQDRERHYPVFYLHDGQNLFDPAAAFAGNPWYVDETAERLIRNREIRPLILVGVGNSPDRLREYGPRTRRIGVADLAKNYGRFLTEELKPFIDKNYRTLTGPTDTAVGGSSMGGLISLHLARWHPDVYGLCAALSPSLWWNRTAFLRTVKTRTAWLRNCRLWLDFGTRETPSGQGLVNARDLAEKFRELGLRDERDFAFREIPNGEHNESAWRYRFHEVLRFLFGRG